SQPANGGLRNAIGAGQLCLRGALREALHGLTALMGCERRRATEAHALRLRAVAAGAGSGEDKLALELGQPAEHGWHETTVRRGRIGPGITQRLEGGTGLADRVQDVEQVAGARCASTTPRTVSKPQRKPKTPWRARCFSGMRWSGCGTGLQHPS